MIRRCQALSGSLLARFFGRGCAAPGLEREPTQNAAVELELLFSHEGCDIYRFHDGNATVYYADCDHSASTSRQVSCGRDCERHEVVSTAE